MAGVELPSFTVEDQPWIPRVPKGLRDLARSPEAALAGLNRIEAAAGVDLPAAYRHFAPQIQGAVPADADFAFWGAISADGGMARRRATLDRFLIVDATRRPDLLSASVLFHYEFIRDLESLRVPIGQDVERNLICLRYEVSDDAEPWVTLLKFSRTGEVAEFPVSPSFEAFLNLIADERAYACLPEDFDEFIAMASDLLIRIREG